YEMLTGHTAFEGETIGEILGGVFKAEPDWQRLPAETPEAIRRLLLRCLQKDRKRRLHDAADVRIEIEEAQGRSPVDVTHRPVIPRRSEWIAWAALTVVTLVAAAGIMWTLRAIPVTSEMRVEISTLPTANLASFAISPDGQKIVFVAN